MSVSRSFKDSDGTEIRFEVQSQILYFKAKGLRPGAKTEITLNKVRVDDFAYPDEIVQIEFDNNSSSNTFNWQGGHLGNLFSVDGFVEVVEPILGSSSTRNICRGDLLDLEVISYNEQTKIGVANVHVFLDSPGRSSGYNELDTRRVITANSTFLQRVVKSGNGNSSIRANNKIIAFYPSFCRVSNATSNTIQLNGKVVNSAIANASSGHYIVGKKIYILYGSGSGQNATVASYNATTRTVTLSSNLIRPAKAGSIVRFTELNSDSRGTLHGATYIDPLIRSDLLDEVSTPSDLQSQIENNSKFKIFQKNNTFEFYNGTTVKSTVETTTVTPDTEIKSNVDNSLTPTTTSATPFAQTFFVDNKLYPDGIFLTSVRLLFRNKDPQYPVQIQIRPTKSSIPEPATVVAGGDAFIDSFDTKILTEDTLKVLNINNVNPFSNSAYYSEATFKSPVFLEPNKEYAIVVMSPSPKYELYLSQIGQKLLGTNRTISAQPYTGVLYKSQGTSEWAPSPSEDLAFELMKARYSTTTPTIVSYYLKDSSNVSNTESANVSIDNTAPVSNINLHAFHITTSSRILPNTKIDFEFKSTRINGAVDQFTKFDLGETFEYVDNYGSRVVTSNNESFVIRSSLYTTSPHVAPSLNFDDFRMLNIEYMIDNNSIANSDIFMTNLGQDYSNAQNVVVTISGGGGTGATARANVQNGQVIALEIINGGTGYTGSPNVIISKDTTATINAQAVIIGEDQPNGGVAMSKYITRKFTLADGLNGGDLRVLFSAIKPRECEIDVYYKVLSEDDADSFDNKRWKLMTLIGGVNAYSLNEKDYKNYIYAPGVSNVADNYIKYDGFTSFKYFAIKITMRSTNNVKVPKIKEFRAVALSELLT